MPSARDALLDKAMVHVAAHGLSDLSLRELATAIGTSHRMLLYHFGSREGLVAAIVAAMESQQRDALAALADSASSPRDLIESQWAQLTDPALRPFVALFFEVLALAVHRRPGTEGFLEQLTDPVVGPRRRRGRPSRRGRRPRRAPTRGGRVTRPAGRGAGVRRPRGADRVVAAVPRHVGGDAELGRRRRRPRSARMAEPARMGESGGVNQGERNPHAGAPFTDDDAAIAAALEDVTVPALLCSFVHITGDPSWIRGDLHPSYAMLNDYQGGMSEEDQAEARRRGPAGHRRVPRRRLPAPAPALTGAGPRDDVVPRLRAGRRAGRAHVPRGPAPRRRRQRRHRAGATRSPPTRRADAHTVVIGCGEAGLLTGIRLAQAGVPFTIVEKSMGPGGTWWDNRYPGARVDIGSHFYCYSFEPSDHWGEYFAQQPELKRVLRPGARRLRHPPALPVRHRGDRGRLRRGHRSLGRHRPHRRRHHRRDRRPLRGQRRRRAQPAQAAGHPGHGRLRRTVVPLGPLGPGRRRGRAAGSPSSAPAPAASRSPRPSPTRSSTSRSSSAPRSGCSRTRSTTSTCPPGTPGPCATCRSTGAGSAS